MDTRFKLEEAQYFLKKLIRLKAEPELANFYLSAFLSAWRSVLDVALFDFVKYYPLRLDEESKLRITDRDFWVAANALSHIEALRFIRWWRQKADIVRKHPLSKERNKIVHKGYPPRIVYAPQTLSSGAGLIVSERGEVVASSGALPGGVSLPIIVVAPSSTIEIEFPDIVNECMKGLTLMKGIVKEAEKEFNIQL